MLDTYFHIHACIHTYVPTYLPTYLHTYIHTYTHTYIHTYIHRTISVFPLGAGQIIFGRGELKLFFKGGMKKEKLYEKERGQTPFAN